MPLAKQGDYAFLLHILTSLKTTGKGAVILPHGVLFRGNAEDDIRKAIVNQGYIKGIIGLPANLFYGAPTFPPASSCWTRKAGRRGIFMMDANKGYMKDGIPNRDIDGLAPYWQVFPSVRQALFSPLPAGEDAKPLSPGGRRVGERGYSQLNIEPSQIKTAISRGLSASDTPGWRVNRKSTLEGSQTFLLGHWTTLAEQAIAALLGWSLRPLRGRIPI